jgi:xylan 1,4-beta-xylosidase
LKYSVYKPNEVYKELPFKMAVQSGTMPFVYHWHNEIEILCGLQNDIIVGIEDTHYDLKPGDIIIIGQGMDHCLFSSDINSKRLAIVFDPSVLFRNPALITDKNCFINIMPHSSAWPKETHQTIKKLVEDIYTEVFNKRRGYVEKIVSDLYAIEAETIRNIPVEHKFSDSESQSSLRSILTYLSSHYLEEITLESCAGDIGFNPSYLSTTFKKHTGVSFHQYLINLRLNEAENLLTSTDNPIDMISESSGFPSVKTFYRVFLDKYGVSPGNFRKSRMAASFKTNQISVI